MDAIAQEATETYERFVARRDEIDCGRRRRWSSLADFFTEDAAYMRSGLGPRREP